MVIYLFIKQISLFFQLQFFSLVFVLSFALYFIRNFVVSKILKINVIENKQMKCNENNHAVYVFNINFKNKYNKKEHNVHQSKLEQQSL